MAQWDAHQVASVWESQGGPASRAVEWTAIAMGESSFQTDALSPAGAIGLWQIMPEHASEFGVTVASLYDPRTNALIAVSLSGYGTNCAAWDSAYRDINASGRYRFLGYPEVGSADYNNIAIVAQELGRSIQGGGQSTMPPVPGRDADSAVARINHALGSSIPASARTLINERQVLNRMYTRGWRP